MTAMVALSMVATPWQVIIRSRQAFTLTVLLSLVMLLMSWTPALGICP